MTASADDRARPSGFDDLEPRHPTRRRRRGRAAAARGRGAGPARTRRPLPGPYPRSRSSWSPPSTSSPPPSPAPPRPPPPPEAPTARRPPGQTTGATLAATAMAAADRTGHRHRHRGTGTGTGTGRAPACRLGPRRAHPRHRPVHPRAAGLLRFATSRPARRQRGTPEPWPRPPLRHRRPTAGPDRPRRRLPDPRLPHPRTALRRPPPPTLVRRRPHRPPEPGPALPTPPHRDLRRTWTIETRAGLPWIRIPRWLHPDQPLLRNTLHGAQTGLR